MDEHVAAEPVERFLWRVENEGWPNEMPTEHESFNSLKDAEADAEQHVRKWGKRVVIYSCTPLKRLARTDVSVENLNES